MKTSSTLKLPDPNYHQILKTIWTDAGAWPEFVEAMQRSISPESHSQKTSRKPSKIWWLQLPVLCCEALGRNPADAQPIALAWGLLYTAAHLMDSVADNDEVPAWMAEAGPGSMINIATGLYASSALALGKMLEEGIEPGIVTKIENRFDRSILQMCSGQHLDLDGTFQGLDTCWRVVRAKSGAMFELACTAGAMLATEDVHLISLFGEFGTHLGIMVQICDDASDIWSFRKNDCGKLNCYSIPIAYTLSVLSEGEREHFISLLDHGNNDSNSAAAAYEVIENAGAMLYVQTKIQYHREQAMKALHGTHVCLPISEKLVDYVEQMAIRS